MRAPGLPFRFCSLLLVLVAGALFTIGSLVSTDARREAFFGHGIAEIVRGETSAAFDRLVEEEHPWRPVALNTVAAFRYLAFRDAPGIVVGEEGFLFTLEEVERFPDEERVLEQRIAMIAERARELSDRGVALVVVLVPGKARVYADLLPPRFRPGALHPRLDIALDALRSRGVSVIDVRDDLSANRFAQDSDPAFFRRDTHWTPHGADLVASRIAQVVASPALAQYLEGAPRMQYRALPAGAVEVPGDLMNFLPVGALRRPLGLPVEHALQPRYERTAEEATGLFGAIGIPIVLVGTSFSADERWAFDTAIGVHTSLDVLNLAESGEGPFVPMVRALDEGRFREYGTRVVVWEVPERYLTIPIP